MHTNEVISYNLSQSPNMVQIANMLEKAFSKVENTDGIIFHSDQGWQYQHAYYRDELKRHRVIQSMSRKGNCYDNSINNRRIQSKTKWMPPTIFRRTSTKCA